MRMSDGCGASNRFEAEGIMKNISSLYKGGKVAPAKEAYAFLTGKNIREYSRQTFMVREFQSNRLLVEKNKDLKCEETGIIVESKALLKAQDENPKIDIFKPGEKILFFIDPESIGKTAAGLYVLENPKIKAVQNPVLEYGGAGKADKETGIAIEFSKDELTAYSKAYGRAGFDSNMFGGIRHNRFKKGTWGVTIGINVSDGSLDVNILNAVFGSANLDKSNFILALLPSE